MGAAQALPLAMRAPILDSLALLLALDAPVPAPRAVLLLLLVPAGMRGGTSLAAWADACFERALPALAHPRPPATHARPLAS